MPPSSAFQWFLLVCPAVIILSYFVTVFPHTPQSVHIHSSLALLDKSHPSWTLYPDNFYEGGAYVRLPYGSVRYWLIGPEDGQRVVLIHGLSVPSIIWKDVAPKLAAKGHRVLLYDLYGRGYSDAPHTTYDANLYSTQLALLLQHIRWERASIAGLSMGGGIAATFSAQFPHLVTNKIVLISSAGLMESSDLSRTTKFLSSPLMQAVTSSVPFRFYLQYLANQTPSNDSIGELVRIQSAYLPGYNLALASSIRDGPLRSLAPQFAALGRHSRKTGGQALVIWGTNDKVVPYRYASRVQTLIPHSELVTIQGGPHDITISHPDEVAAAMIEFLGR
ncbi:alpha/beta-hydrolase [Epithele typhae]|uniref:alpha/beta-hydrolase n=1 Tax=Epithele typhae TaxID=378194 RepID=UPI0020072FC5|nr:alpha/beta-hydrolase [Epithele typhae]KAH9927074.1 alpha/beta-hydrolase [Epithele typhae]